VYYSCTVRGNTCYYNGYLSDGAGIHATGRDNRIEANNCTTNDRGIDVDDLGNFISRNTCSGNRMTNWDVVAGNVILVVNATTAGAINGNSGGTAPGSTDPNANFTY
jgi:parallel beta-helix repeat protein